MYMLLLVPIEIDSGVIGLVQAIGFAAASVLLLLAILYALVRLVAPLSANVVAMTSNLQKSVDEQIQTNNLLRASLDRSSDELGANREERTKNIQRWADSIVAEDATARKLEESTTNLRQLANEVKNTREDLLAATTDAHTETQKLIIDRFAPVIETLTMVRKQFETSERVRDAQAEARRLDAEAALGKLDYLEEMVRDAISGVASTLDSGETPAVIAQSDATPELPAPPPAAAEKPLKTATIEVQGVVIEPTEDDAA